MKQIVVPELREYARKLEANQDKIPIECKLSGVPIHAEDTAGKLIERLVAVQEYKVRRLLKERLSAEDASERLLTQGALTGDDLASNREFIATQALIRYLRVPLSELDASLAEADIDTLVLP